MHNGLYQVRVPDATDYWMEMVKCRHACPVHTDACGYVTAIAEGRYEDAYRIARAHNPFASICGRVCGAPCEANCRRGDLDAPVAIRPLKRFVTSQFGPETGDYAALPRCATTTRCCRRIAATTSAIAVVGAGVSGLTVAHDLVKIGYKVTVFEAISEPGGMLTAGRPGFPPAARTGPARNPGHPLARRRAEVQHAAGPRLHDRRVCGAKATRRSSSASACPRAASCPSPAPKPKASSTAWIFCAPSMPARRCRSASASS